jgi:sugar phosphate isomerase/epimerase
MVYGSPGARRREDLPIDRADEETVSFFSELSPMIESHGTCVVIEPLRECETDYIYTLRHAMKLVHAVDRIEVRSHMDAKAVAAADEDNLEVFEEAAPTLEHFHANDPGLGILGETSEVDHSNMGALLRKINYQGYVSIEQRMVDPIDPIGPIQTSHNVLSECYS